MGAVADRDGPHFICPLADFDKKIRILDSRNGAKYTHEHVAKFVSAPPSIAGAPTKLTHFVFMPFGRCTKCVQTCLPHLLLCSR
jgi:hypothetical protein